MNRKLLLSLIAGCLTIFIANGQAPVAKFTSDKTAGCPPLIVTFTDQSTNGPNTLSWNFGGTPPDVSPATSTSPTQVVTFQTPGTYYVTLTATNGSGSNTSAPMAITVYPAPKADFNASDTLGCFPLHVQFTDASNPGSGASITSWLWDFGDGSAFGTIPSPAHIYTLQGSFPVTLQVTNSYGCQGSQALKTVSGYIIVNNGVLPNFSDSLSSSCKPPTIAYFSNQTTGPGTITYNWNFGDGGTATSTNPSHTYTTAGTYTVHLTAQSNQGCTDSIQSNVIINAGSVQSTFISLDSVCIGTIITFQNTSSPTPNSTNWSFGDGNTSTVYSPTYTYNTPGTYTVTLNNNFATCDDSTSKLIHVFAPPTVDFKALTATGSCKPPLTVNFEQQTVGATSWIWNFGDGTPNVTGPNPSHTFTTYGQFTVTLAASNASGCSNTISKTQFVQVVKPSVVISNLPAYGCAPFTYSPTITDTVVDGIASYFWDFGNGNTSTLATPPPQTYNAGKYVVKLTITSTGGCTASYADTVEVGTVKPTPAFTANPTSVCVGSPVSFLDQSTGGANQWLWNFGDGGSSKTENPAYSYTKPGTFSVTLTAYNNGCYDTLTKVNYIVVNPPLANFGYTINCNNKAQYTFSDSSIGAVSWDWDFGDGSPHYTLGPNPPPHTYPPIVKSYTVSLTVKNGGCTNTATQTINVLQQINFLSTAYNICKNTSITISATVANNIKYYTYDFGDGTRVGPVLSSNWTHFYTTTGNFTVKVITTDTTGCQDSVTKTNFIQVNGPTADFSAPTTQACNNLNAQFKDQSTSGVSPIKNWAWDFGDGGTSTSTNPSHVYNIQGVYPVKLKVTDAAGCSDSVIKSNYIILSNPTAKFSTPDSMYCPTSFIKFTNLSIGGFNPVYTWDFGNGNTFIGTNPPLQNYPNKGKFTVSLTVKDSYGCIASYVKNNYINIDTPVASFKMTDSIASCPPLQTQFIFTGSYNKTVQWAFDLNNPGEGVSDSLNPHHLYAIPKTYYPTLTVTSPGGCVARYTDSVIVLGPYGILSYSPTSGCDSLTVNFNFTVTTTGAVVRYSWYTDYGADSLITSVPSTSFTYPQAGKYNPFILVSNSSNCVVRVAGSSGTIVVDSVKAKFGIDKPVVCSSGNVQFTDSSYTVSKSITNYFWDFGDGNTLNGAFPNPSHFYSTPGLYSVKEIVTSQFGCEDSITRVNLINVVEPPSIDIGGAVSQCPPATLNFTGILLAPDPNTLTWSWDFDNGQSSNQQNPPAQVYPKAGHYTITLAAADNFGCTDSASADLFIYPLPNVNAGADTTICLGQNVQLQATGAAVYNWLPPTNSSLNCVNCSNPVASPIVTTTYIVNGTSVNGCQAQDTVIVNVNQPVSVTVNPPDSVCLGQSTQLTASGAFFYAWTPVAGLNNPNIANPLATPNTTTTYEVIGSDSKYCFSDTQYVKVSVFNYPTINVGPDATILVGSSYQINGTGSPDIVSINWLPVTGLSCTDCLSPLATPKNTTTYVATVVNNGTCAASDSIKITVVCNNNNFFVPNTFSPNDDGVNDVFYVRGKGLNIIPSITIFNRWGQIVFEKRDFAPNDPSAGWDGTIDGKKAPVDVYVYTIEIICDNSTLIPYHGNVTLIR